MLNSRNLLINLLKVFNASYTEDHISGLIQKWLIKNNIPFKVDAKGNIYNFSLSNAPFLSAHLDSVQKATDAYAGKTIQIIGDIISSPNHIMGADDLVGVYIILHLLKYEPMNFNWILSVQEETGAEGATFFAKENKKLIEDSLYGIVIDRRGNSDIICGDNLYGTYAFEKDLELVGTQLGYKATSGIFSDCDVWKNHISCANLSCGYYEPHSTKEYINFSDVIKCKDFIKKIITKLTNRYEPEQQCLITKNYSGIGKFDDFSYDKAWFNDYTSRYNGYEDDFFVTTKKEPIKLKHVKIEACQICGEMPERDLMYIKKLDICICDFCAHGLYNDVEEEINRNIYLY